MERAFDLCGALRRIRRVADCSQRELAERLGVSQSVISRAEAGSRGLPVELLARAAALAGLCLALVDGEGRPVAAMADGAVRDMGYRRFPAHLDTRHSEDNWWHGPERYSRPEPWYTFDLARERRDGRRRYDGTPADHQLPQPGDSPPERRAARQKQARLERAEELNRLLEQGAFPPWPDVTCACPPECEEVDTGGRPVHAPHCRCLCDLD